MRQSLPARVACTLLLFLQASVPANAQSAVEEFRCENGLRVMLRPIPGGGQTALVVLFRVGSRHDPPGRSGLAHLSEHLYVTAAAGSTPARTVDDIVRRYPAGWNAQTGEDFTVIATLFPPDLLEQELTDAAARMSDLRLTQADLDREVPRLVQELHNMFGGIPSLAAMNLARERLRPTPHGGRKGGVPEEIAALDRVTLADRIRTLYTPANAIVVLAGGFDPGIARSAVRRILGPLPAGEPVPPPAPASVPQPTSRTEKIVVLPAGGRPEVVLAIAPPEFDSPQFAPFLVLISRLWAGAASLASEPGRFPVIYSILEDPGIVTIGLPVAAGADPESVMERLERFLTDTLPARLQSQERIIVRNAFSLQLGVGATPEFALAQNPYGVAFSLARRAQWGIDPAALDAALEKVDDAALRAAAERFAPERRATMILLPR